MILNPLIDLGLCKTQNVIAGVGSVLAAVDMQEIQATGSLIQILGITGGIAVVAKIISLDQSSRLGVIFLLADDLLLM